jgi:hypothetical protein
MQGALPLWPAAIEFLSARLVNHNDPYPSRGGELARIGPEEVRQRYGVDPNQVPDFIALRGDPSDKLPGAPASARNAQRNCCGGTERLMASLMQGSFKLRPGCYASID